LSPALAAIVGATEMHRYDVVRQVWKYIRDNKLQVHFLSMDISCCVSCCVSCCGSCCVSCCGSCSSYIAVLVVSGLITAGVPGMADAVAAVIAFWLLIQLL
jgi:SWIB/MDM2 domain